MNPKQHASTAQDSRTGEPQQPQLHRWIWMRWVLIVTGFVSLALGITGVFLPGLPTTPFLILSTYCFAKASPKLHRWLLEHPTIGPPLQDWEAHRSITRRVRFIALTSMSIMVMLATWMFRGNPWMMGLLLSSGALGAWVVLRIKVRD